MPSPHTARTAPDGHRDRPATAPARPSAAPAGLRRAPAALAVGALVWGALTGCTGEPDPGPTPSLSPTGEPAPEGAVSALDAGAAGDGTTDDFAALQAALDDLESGQSLVLDEGSTFAVSDILTITRDGVTVTGGGTLLSTDEERSSLLVQADDVTLEDIDLTIEPTTRRFDAYEHHRIRLDGTAGTTVSDVRITGSAATGIYVGGGSTGWVLDRLVVEGTEADGIHITQGSSQGRVLDPQVTDSGDDGVAVVSYAPDGAPSRDVVVERPVVRGSEARGVSVVGGENITYRDIEVVDSAAASVYVAAEDSYDTAGVAGVSVEGGTITGANTNAEIDHGAVLVFASSGSGVSDVSITGLTITGTRPSASADVGILAFGSFPATGISITDLTVSGGPDTLLRTPESDPQGLVTTGWTVDGTAVPPEQLQS